MLDEIERLKIRVDKAFATRQKSLKSLAKSTGSNRGVNMKKFQILNEKYWLLEERLEYLDSYLVASDDEIEIKTNNRNLDCMYGIFLKSNGLKIGHIDYRGYHDSIISGDIGYVIDSKYNGHNYAYKALCLLSGYLNKNNITDFYISVFKDNYPSMKIIEKYGGSIIYEDDMIITYQCDTIKKTYQK